MMLRPSVVSSNTAMTLTMAECLMRLMSTPVIGGSMRGTAWGNTTSR